MRRAARTDDTTPVVSVTTAPRSAEEEQAQRIKRYLITMSIRTTCFVLMVVFDGWLRWAFAAGAAFLPYVAVVLANAHSPRSGQGLPPVIPRPDDLHHIHR